MDMWMEETGQRAL